MKFEIRHKGSQPGRRAVAEPLASTGVASRPALRCWRGLVDELAARGFLKACLSGPGLELAHDRGIKSGCGGLTCGRGPVTLGGHGLDQGLAGPGLARFLE